MRAILANEASREVASMNARSRCSAGVEEGIARLSDVSVSHVAVFHQVARYDLPLVRNSHFSNVDIARFRIIVQLPRGGKSDRF